jgi:adenylate cyclase
VDNTLYQTDIVIVDSDDDSVEFLTGLLSGKGYQVIVAASGEQGIQVIQEHLPDLVLLHIQLPDMDGYTVCTRLQSHALSQDIPVIFLSDSPTPEDLVKAFQAGGRDYIPKPFADQEVLARVDNQLQLAQAQNTLRQQNALLTQEVRERTQVEQALLAIQKNYRSIFQNSTAGMFTISAAGKFLSVNRSMAEMYGYDSPGEMIMLAENVGQQIYAQPKRRDELVVYLDRYDKITDAESEVRRKDGSTFWVSEDIWKVWDKDGNFVYYEGIAHDISERRKMETELRQQRQQADRLLINILPYQIAQRLKLGTRTIAESLDQVSVLFADLVDFTAASSEMTPQQLVKLLNEIFSVFDQLAEFHKLEKIKTIGDAYMVAGGLPTPNDYHNESIAEFALDMREAIQDFKGPDGNPFQLRIGIHTGPVIAGVIGRRKFAYDLWGDTVNIASRMEATGESQRIQVTPEMYDLIQDKFLFEKRGYVSVKGRGQMMTYWLLARKFHPPKRP